MPNRLRRILLGVPVIMAVGLFALYVIAGYFVLPVVVKWQVEKQVPEKLGHRISVGESRFDPFAFWFEVKDLALSDPEGRPMLAFKRLLVDFELPNVIDRAWTFAQASLDAPVVHFGIDEQGRHNFSAILDRLRDHEESEKKFDALPRFLVKRLTLAGGPIEFSDRLIDEESVSESMLAQLAARRGEAILREVTTGGVPAARVLLGEPRKEADGNEKTVALRVELEVAK